jgi:hypothetical protein
MKKKLSIAAGAAKSFTGIAAIAAVCALALNFAACRTTPTRVVVQEDKGTPDNIPTPQWLLTYLEQGISAVQALPVYKDKYCIIGEERGTNLEFVLAWSDSFSAQQRIGAMLRTNIASKFQAAVRGKETSSGGANSSAAAGAASGELTQEIDNSINAVVNTSYSGAQREADWWRLTRRYDPDQKGVYVDEYQAYVLYTIPKLTLNQQIASNLETSVSKDSQLYDITINLAREILQNGMDYLNPAAAADTGSNPQAAAQGGTATVTLASADNPANFISLVKIYDGSNASGTPRISFSTPILAGREAAWNLPEGAYTFSVFYNDAPTEWARATVGVTTGGVYRASAVRERDYAFKFEKQQ